MPQSKSNAELYRENATFDRELFRSFNFTFVRPFLEFAVTKAIVNNQIRVHFYTATANLCSKLHLGSHFLFSWFCRGQLVANSAHFISALLLFLIKIYDHFKVINQNLIIQFS